MLHLCGEAMKIKSIKVEHLEEPIPVYDVINAAPNNNFIVKAGDSTVVAHNCFLDEISFARNSNIQRQMEKAKEVFDAALERIQSRFTKFGGIFDGLIVMASSKRTDQAFAEVYAQQLLEGENGYKTYVFDKPRWEVLPPGTYSGKTFPVAIGDKLRPSEIILEKDVEVYRQAGYRIIYPPIETYDNFKRDMISALTNIAGESVNASGTFIAGEYIAKCISPLIKNPFRQSVIYCGTKDSEMYHEYFDMSLIAKEDLAKPLYIHIDASLGNDGNSISGGNISYAQNQLDEQTGLVQPELHYRQVFKIKVRAPKGDRTMLRKNEQFIFWLVRQGFRIAAVTSDQYQSKQLGQDLLAAGINYREQSIDRVTSGINQPYSVLRNAIYEQRISLLDDQDQTDELLHLVRYEDGRVDKPAGGCFTGDTKVSLCDGRELSFLELVEEAGQGKVNYVYSFNLETKKIEPRKIKRAWLTLKNQPLVEVILDNGEIIRCTRNHKFMLRDGTYEQAQNLIGGQSLMPLYRRYPDSCKYPDAKGMDSYRLYYEPFDSIWHFEHHRFVGEPLKYGCVVHHKDCNPSNNSPDNLEQLTRAEHAERRALQGARISQLRWYTNREKKKLNHSVVSVRFLEYTEDVYDIEVDSNHNFALSSGVFVHNSDDASQALTGWVYAASLNKEYFIQTNAVLEQTMIGSTQREQMAEEQGVAPDLFIDSATFLNEFGAYKVERGSGIRGEFDRVVGTKKNKGGGTSGTPSPFNFF